MGRRTYTLISQAGEVDILPFLINKYIMEDQIMAEQEKEIVAEEDVDYIQAITELKKNTVSKDTYEKLKAEKQQLLTALMEGGQVDMIQEEEKPSITDLANKIATNTHMSNVEYIQTMCDYYDALVAGGYGDLAITVKHGGAYSQEDALAVERTISGLKELLEEADGDDNIFTSLYQSVVRDVSIPRKK